MIEPDPPHGSDGPHPPSDLVELERSRRQSDTADHDDQREWDQRDRDRVLYSRAFRRLAEVTQVVSPYEGHLVHNRLTHSMKVAQIARRIAEHLVDRDDYPAIKAATNSISPEVAEAAALAHDLGHPPFGHVVEAELDAIAYQCQLDDGFNGNAQTFRIITALETRRLNTAGLDLSRATLNAVLKYPWHKGERGKKRDKFGMYQIDGTSFDFARTYCRVSDPFDRSAEAEIMDWSDDVTYAVHDLEDFFCAGLIPLPLIASTSGKTKSDKREFDRLLESFWRLRAPKVVQALQQLKVDRTSTQLKDTQEHFAEVPPA